MIEPGDIVHIPVRIVYPVAESDTMVCVEYGVVRLLVPRGEVVIKINHEEAPQ